ncbi:MAG: hypothetical protein ACFB2W_21695 [Leptolyngbyaceae cyanobacterium]
MAFFSKPVTSSKTSTKLAMVGMLLAATMASACASGPEATTTPAEEENVTTEELVEETDSLIGQTVSIRGEVADVIGDASFLVRDGQFFDDDEILVINVSGQPLMLPEVGESQVQVTGEIQQLSLDEAEVAYNLTLDPETYADYEEQPVIIAQSVALAPDPGDITANPEEYYNQVIAVEGEIEDVLAPDIFTLDEDRLFGADDLLVIGTQDAADIKDESVVTITGVLRPYVKADFERDYDLTWDLSVQETIEGEYSEKPVFVADEIYPSAVPE